MNNWDIHKQVWKEVLKGLKEAGIAAVVLIVLLGIIHVWVHLLSIEWKVGSVIIAVLVIWYIGRYRSIASKKNEDEDTERSTGQEREQAQ